MSCLFVGISNAQLVGLTSELHANSVYGSTHRVYVEFDSPTDYITSIYALESYIGAPDIILSSSSSNGFFQASINYDFAEGVNPLFFGVFPDLAYDSWLTIGAAPGETGEVQSINLNGPLASFNSGGSFDTGGLEFGGSWFTTTPNPFFPDAEGRILIAQLTTEEDATIEIQCNVQWRNAANVTTNSEGLTLVIGDDGSGCTDPTACNFDSGATADDGSCAYPVDEFHDCAGECLQDDDNDGICNAFEVLGCPYSSACNYDPNATENDGSCEFPEPYYDCNGSCFLDSDSDGICDALEVLGCTDLSACNFDATATDSAQCDYPVTGYDCAGECLMDSDGDGVCDAFEIEGCQNPVACNFNESATDPGIPCIFSYGCDYCSGENDGSGTVLEGDGDNDGICDIDEVAGCQDSWACNYNSIATDSSDCIYALGCDTCSGEADGSGFVVDNDADDDGVCNDVEIAGCTNPMACNFNENATDEAGNCLFALGCDQCSGSADGLGYVIDGDSDDDGVCDIDEVTGCMDPVACNFLITATDVGPCEYPASGYDCQGSCLNDLDNDGVCDGFEISGCTYVTACNYDALATDDDGSCNYAATGFDCLGNCLFDVDGDGVCDQWEVAGCQDENACNYDASATNTGTCIYPETHYDCSGSCLNDTDGDGVCDELEVLGCTDHASCNYDSGATDHDGSCNYAVSGYDCSGNCLFDVDGDGVCDQWEVTGCQDENACNYDASATNAGTCIYPETHYDCSGNCLNDTDGDGVCDELEVLGCTDYASCNYDSDATDDDGSCNYAVSGYDCSGNCLFDVDGDGVCDQWEVTGCQDENACNYDASATNAGTCIYPDANYDCSGNCLNDTDGDGVCDELEFLGCMDELASNFNLFATDDNGGCTFEILGCTYSDACNFDPEATADDGGCIWDCFGCLDQEAINFSPGANQDDGSCMYCTEENVTTENPCTADLDNDGVRGTPDLLILLSFYGMECE